MQYSQNFFLVYPQVANAANYGAIAAILYSDPADYAQQGGEPENTYPNTAWLPASGVQRGSLYTMPGSGDPQTPGIAALVGMFRRSLNDSELPPIPAHPMGYGDAIHFLKRIKGNGCIQLFALCSSLPGYQRFLQRATKVLLFVTKPRSRGSQKRHHRHGNHARKTSGTQGTDLNNLPKLKHSCSQVLVFR